MFIDLMISAKRAGKTVAFEPDEFSEIFRSYRSSEDFLDALGAMNITLLSELR